MNKNYAEYFFSVLFCFFIAAISFGQNIAVNTNGNPADASALLDIGNGTAAAGGDTKGLLIPRVALISSTDATTISAPATSLIVYCSGTGGLSPAGYYYWNGSSWVQLGGSSGSGWLTTGNTLTGTLPASPNEWIGTINGADWIIKTNNAEKMRVSSAGNVGIGSAAPTEMLHLAKAGNTVIRHETQSVTLTPLSSSAGPTYATADVDDASIGTVAWTTPGNATASDNVYATVALVSAATPQSHYLKATGFGFAIPGTATVLGIVVEWEKHVSSSGAGRVDNAVRIVKNGVIGTTDKASAANWPAGDAVTSYGTGTTDLWGLTWTPADINAATFGAALSAKNTTITSRTFSVDAVRITVYYSTPVVSTVDWTVGGDQSDFGKYKISEASTIGSNNRFTIDEASGNVGIGTTSPDASALLNVSATNKGVLIPNVALTSSTDAATISSPATSLMVYCTGTGGLTPAGYYYNSGTSGSPVWTSLGSAWLLTGNASTVDGTNFIGTTNTAYLDMRVNNQLAGRIYSTDLMTSYGYQALNTKTGYGVVAIGYQALVANTRNDAASPLPYGWGNVAVGYEAQLGNTTGSYNTSLGNSTIQNNTAGNFNTAVGNIALVSTTGSGNVGVGAAALEYNSSGTQNTSIGGGYFSGTARGTGDGVTTGLNNSFLGYMSNTNAGASSNRTAIGALAYVTQDNSLVLGSINGTNGATATTNVGIGCTAPQYPLHVVGNVGVVGTIYATAASVTAGVLACSDIRYKKDIAPLPNSLQNVLKLQGVNYFWKTKDFPDKHFTDTKQIGVIAQEIEKIYPELVFTDKDGYKSVDYSRLTPILIEAIKEQQKIIEELRVKNDSLNNKQQAEIDVLKEAVAKLAKQNSVPISQQVSVPPQQTSTTKQVTEQKKTEPNQVINNSDAKTQNQVPAFSPAPPPR